MAKIEKLSPVRPTEVDTGTPAQPRIDVQIVTSLDERQMVAAIRAAVLMGEKEGNYADHFDENDHCGTLLLAFVDGEPAGTVRVRWFANFARIEKMILRKRYRNFRVLNALVNKALRLCKRKGYQQVGGLAFPEVVPFWQRKGGFVTGEPIQSVYGPMVPVMGNPKGNDDVEPIVVDLAGQGDFEKGVYRWEGIGI